MARPFARSNDACRKGCDRSGRALRALDEIGVDGGDLLVVQMFESSLATLAIIPSFLPPGAKPSQQLPELLDVIGSGDRQIGRDKTWFHLLAPEIGAVALAQLTSTMWRPVANCGAEIRDVAMLRYMSTSSGAVWNLPIARPTRPIGPKRGHGVSLPPLGSPDRGDQRCDLRIGQELIALGRHDHQRASVMADPLADRLGELLVGCLGRDQSQVGRVKLRDLRIVEEKVALELVAMTADTAENMELARPVGELRRCRRHEPLRLGRCAAQLTLRRTRRRAPQRPDTATARRQTYPVQRNTFAMLIAPC